MSATDHATGQPKIAENTTAGAAMIVPHDIARESRNRNAVSDRVFASKRRSRILVRRVHPRAVQERHERDAEDDHRERQPEVELHEPHAVGRALARRADHRDGGELRRHDGQSDRPPWQAAIGEEVSFDVLRAARPSKPVDHDVREPPDDDHPVQPDAYDGCEVTAAGCMGDGSS